MIRDIRIKAALNGFIVECGCQTLVAESVERLISGIRAYLLDPKKVENEWMTTALNHEHTVPALTAVRPEPSREEARRESAIRVPRIENTIEDRSPSNECNAGMCAR